MFYIFASWRYTAPVVLPGCNLDDELNLFRDDKCGFIINKSGPFGDCMERPKGTGLGPSRRRRFYQQCKERYCYEHIHVLGLLTPDSAGVSASCSAIRRKKYSKFSKHFRKMSTILTRENRWKALDWQRPKKGGLRIGISIAKTISKFSRSRQRGNCKSKTFADHLGMGMPSEMNEEF